MRTIQRDIVGVFIFSADDKLVLGKSRKGGVYTDLWIPPGGGIEAGESKFEAARREALEEVGIDITNATSQELEYTQTGHSEKTLRETGEHVLVEMTFYDFAVRLNKPASEINITCTDDIAEAHWFGKTQLANLNFSKPCAYTLKKLGYLPKSHAD